MNKNINTIKKFLVKNYGYLIILTIIFYSSYLLYFVYKNVDDVYKNETVLEQKENLFNEKLYKEIIDAKEKKQSFDYPEQELNNPFII